MKIRNNILTLLAVLFCFSVFIEAKSVNITGGSVLITGGDTFNDRGQPYEQFAQFNLSGNDFSLITSTRQPFTDLYFNRFFQYGLDSGTSFVFDDLVFPFKDYSARFAAVQYRGVNYSRIIHSSQNVLNFKLVDNRLKISETSPYTAVGKFTATGSFLLKCARDLTPPCSGRIQRIKVFGSGTLTVNFRRWTPSEGQWAWLNVDSLNYSFEE